MAPRLIVASLLFLSLPVMAADGLTLSGDQGRSEYYQELAGLRHWLGIPRSALENTRLHLQLEARDLVGIGHDAYGRYHRLMPTAAAAWRRMDKAAREEGIGFVLVSSFRSAEYQARLIRQRLDDGLSIDQVLRAIALPGYSEHHTGCALDLASEEEPALGGHFRETRAYRWLRDHAIEYGFRESYPPGNGDGIIPEPWHWYYQDCEPDGG